MSDKSVHNQQAEESLALVRQVIDGETQVKACERTLLVNMTQARD